MKLSWMARAEFSPLPNEQSSKIPSSLPSTGKFSDFTIDACWIHESLVWRAENRELLSTNAGGYYTALCEPSLPENSISEIRVKLAGSNFFNALVGVTRSGNIKEKTWFANTSEGWALHTLSGELVHDSIWTSKGFKISFGDILLISVDRHLGTISYMNETNNTSLESAF